LNSDDAVAVADRGEAYRAMGQWEAAANDFRRAIELDPQMARAYQSAAWLMATCPDQRYRNPKLAVQAAEKAVAIQGDEDYIYLDTLAAAYANDGQFGRAQSTVRQAIALTPPDYAGRLKMRLDMYRQKKPFRQTLRPSKSQ
jgi:tetratricopeptide (TPR) repeat protein